MVFLRLCVTAAVAAVVVVVVFCDPSVETQAKKPLLPDLDVDYLDEVKDFVSLKDEVNARYSAKINKMDMIEDYPTDEDDDDHHHHHYPGDDELDDDYDDEDYDDDEEDEYDDDDDDDDGGCGGDDDDDDDEDEEELTPVQQVIEDYFS